MPEKKTAYLKYKSKMTIFGDKEQSVVEHFINDSLKLDLINCVNYVSL